MSIEKTEREFDNFMSKIGFTRVSQDVGNSPVFENADYVNKEKRIIVELKILNKEFFENGGVIDSLQSIIIKPVSIDERGLGQYTFQLPDINREGKHDNFEEPIRRIIKKANKQLKETKAYYFNNNESFNFILLAQVGLSSLSPEITSAVVRKILYHEFSSVDGVIICSPYGSLINPVTLKRNPECVSVTKEYDRIKKKMCMDIADLWISFYEQGGHRL